MLKRLLTTGVAAIALTATAYAQGNKMDKESGSPTSRPTAQETAPSARDTAPGQKMQDGDKGARAYAPGQTKTDGDSARDDAPGHKKADSDRDGGPGKKASDANESQSDDATSGDKAKERMKSADDAQPSKSKDLTDSKSEGGKTAKIGNLSQEKKTEVRAVFRKHKVQPARGLDINISVGAVVPRSVTFHPIPRDIVVIAPAYAGYLYFVIGDELCIVDPVTYEIVDIIYV